MAGKKYWASPKDKVAEGREGWRLLTGMILFLLTLTPTGQGSPHTPHKITWEVLSQTGETVFAKQGTHALNTWWPALTPDFCQLAAGLDEWDIPHKDPREDPNDSLPRARRMVQGSYEANPGCASARHKDHLSGKDFYVCPRDDRKREDQRRCGGYQEYFCAAWGCETTGDAYWSPTSSWDKIRVKRGWQKGSVGTTLMPLNITFTEQGKIARNWHVGYTWGLRWYLSGKDKGVIFKIRQKVEPIKSVSIGPNPVIPAQRPPSVPRPAGAGQAGTRSATTTITPRRSPAPATETDTPLSLTTLQPSTGDRLMNLIQGAYLALNQSEPDATRGSSTS